MNRMPVCLSDGFAIRATAMMTLEEYKLAHDRTAQQAFTWCLAPESTVWCGESNAYTVWYENEIVGRVKPVWQGSDYTYQVGEQECPGLPDAVYVVFEAIGNESNTTRGIQHNP